MPTPRRTPAPVTLLLATTNAWISQVFDEELARRGFPPTQVGVLMLIREHEPVTPTDLQSAVGLAATTLRDRVAQLTHEGLVCKVAHPQDRRSYRLETTPAGAELVRTAAGTSRAIERRLAARSGVDIPSLRPVLDALRVAARELLEGEPQSGVSSETTGPW